MDNIKSLYEWTDRITIIHTIKILQDSGISKEDIIQQLDLTEQEYEKMLKITN